jgi:hypothetical protein
MSLFIANIQEFAGLNEKRRAQGCCGGAPRVLGPALLQAIKESTVTAP